MKLEGFNSSGSETYRAATSARECCTHIGCPFVPIGIGMGTFCHPDGNFRRVIKLAESPTMPLRT
jgi:hypothetical protein